MIGVANPTIDHGGLVDTDSDALATALYVKIDDELKMRPSTLIRPAMAGEAPRPGRRFLKPLRQIIESVSDTLKGQLDLERHGGRTVVGVVTRVLQRLLALTAAIWHNERTGSHPVRSLLAYDHIGLYPSRRRQGPVDPNRQPPLDGGGCRDRPRRPS